MPEHTTFLTYLLARFPALQENADNIGYSFFGRDPSYRSFEAVFTSLLVVVIFSLLALRTRRSLADVDRAVVPDDRLTLRTFMEAFIAFFYGIARDVMGPKRAKRYFPIIGGSA